MKAGGAVILDRVGATVAGHNRTVPTVRSGGCRTPWRQLSEGYLPRTGVQGNVRIRRCRFCRQISTHENTANYPLCQHKCGFRRNEGFRIRATGSDVRAQYCRPITKLDNKDKSWAGLLIFCPKFPPLPTTRFGLSKWRPSLSRAKRR